MTVTLNLNNGRYQVLFRQGSRQTLRQLKRALGTSDKKTALQYQLTLQNLCDEQVIHPFDPDFDIKEALNLVKSRTNAYILTLTYAIDLFLDAKRGLKSRPKYEIELHSFRKHGPYTHYPIQRISPDLLSDYIWRDKNNKGHVISMATKSAYWRNLHVFFQFLLDKNLIASNPVKKVIKPTVTQVRNEVISTDADLHKLYHAFDQYQAQQEESNSNYRDWQRQLWFKPLIMLYNATGCRKSQPLSAIWSDLDTDYSGLWVKGIKFERADKVYYYIKYEAAKTALAQLRKITAAKNDDYIFANAKTCQPLTGAHVYKTFKFYAKLAGLSSSIHIHGLRHKSVTDDLKSGIPIHNVSKQHQHSSIAITEKIYAHLDHSFVKNGYDAVYKKGMTNDKEKRKK